MSQKTIEKLHKPNIVCIDISHPPTSAKTNKKNRPIKQYEQNVKRLAGPTHEQQLELSDKIDTSLNELKQIYESIKEPIE
jgi:hypothetical protein